MLSTGVRSLDLPFWDDYDDLSRLSLHHVVPQCAIDHAGQKLKYSMAVFMEAFSGLPQ